MNYGEKVIDFKSIDEEMEFWDTHDVTKFEVMEVTAKEIIDGLQHKSKNTQVTIMLGNGVAKSTQGFRR